MLITPSGLDPVFFPTSPWSTSLEPISQHVLTNLYMHGFRFIQDFYILVLTKFHDSYFLYVYMHVWGILSIRAISNVFSIMTKTFWTPLMSYRWIRCYGFIPWIENIINFIYLEIFIPLMISKKDSTVICRRIKKCLIEWSIKLVNG